MSPEIVGKSVKMSGCGECKNRWVKVSTKVDGVRNGWMVINGMAEMVRT